jgi:hypothetical protein
MHEVRHPFAVPQDFLARSRNVAKGGAVQQGAAAMKEFETLEHEVHSRLIHTSIFENKELLQALQQAFLQRLRGRETV